jgi:hypothetical protein
MVFPSFSFLLADISMLHLEDDTLALVKVLRTFLYAALFTQEFV